MRKLNGGLWGGHTEGGKHRDTSASAWGWGRLFWCLRSHQSWEEGAALKLAWPRVVLGGPTLLDPEQLITGLGGGRSWEPQKAVLSSMGSGDGGESPAWKFCHHHPVTHRQGSQNIFKLLRCCLCTALILGITYFFKFILNSFYH